MTYSGNIIDTDILLIADGATNYKVTAAILAEYINDQKPSTGVPTNILDTDLFLIADSGINYKINAADLAEYVNAKAPATTSDVKWYNGAADGNISGPVLQIPGSNKIWLANNGNLLESTDSGGTFSAVAGAPSLSNWIFGDVGTGMALARGTNGSLYKTTDFAVTWTQVKTSSPGGNGYLHYGYGGSGRWMAATNPGMEFAYSSDNGDTWTDGTLPLTATTHFCAGDRNSGNFYVASAARADSMQYSTDGGATWTGMVHLFASGGTCTFGGATGNQMVITGVRNIPVGGATTVWGTGTPPTSWNYMAAVHTAYHWSIGKNTWYFYNDATNSSYKNGDPSVIGTGGGSILRVCPGVGVHIDDLNIMSGGSPFAFFPPGD